MEQQRLLAAQYSAKCARRRRKTKARQHILEGMLLRFLLPFSVGMVTMAQLLVVLVKG